jgi:alpha-amylase
MPSAVVSMRSDALRGLGRGWWILALGWLTAGCAARGPAGAPPPAPTPATVASEATVAPSPLPARPWSREVLYFAIVDRFADGDRGNDRNVDPSAKGTFHGGDLVGLTEQIDEIASLGATALWITPVVDNVDGFVTGAGFPDWAYHGYWPDDLSRLDPRFGTEAELAALVSAAHARGIRVLLDVVYNHAGYNSRYTTDPATRSWLRTSENGGCGGDDLTTCVSGLPDFRTEVPGIAKQLMDWELPIARRAGVDGFRLDTVKHVPHEFWQEHRRRTRAELDPGFFLLGEVWGGDAQVLDPWFAADELDAGFDFGFQGSALGWVQGRGRTVAFERYLESRDKVRAGHLLAHFLSSHDVPGALFQLGGDKELFRLAAALEMTPRGIPVVYYGEEVARPGGDWPDNRSDMPWGELPIQPGAGKPRDEALRKDYQRLIAIRRAHPALADGSHHAVSTEGDLLVFSRVDDGSGETVAVAVNRGASPAKALFLPPDSWKERRIRELWTDTPLVVGLGGGEDAAVQGVPFVVFDVPPHAFRIVAAEP